MKKISYLMALLFVSLPVQTFAATPEPPTNENATRSINWILHHINVLSGVLLATAILGIIYSAYLYITSKGEPQKLSEAKGWMMNSGLFIILILSFYTLMRLLTSLF